MVPFCRIFVTPLEGHVHLCDKNPMRERKAIRNADLIEKIRNGYPSCSTVRQTHLDFDSAISLKQE